MYLGETEKLVGDQELVKDKQEQPKSSVLPLVIFVGGTLITMFMLRNWFPEGRFND